MKFALAQSYLLSRKFEEAVKMYQALESVPTYREQALNAQVYIYRQMQRPDEAMGVLERIIAPEIKQASQASAAVMLAQMYAEAKKTDKLLALMKALESKKALIDNVAALNAVAVKLGDELRAKKQFDEALSMYRSVRPRAEVLAAQQAKIAVIARHIETNTKSAAGNPPLMAQMNVANSQLALELEAAKKMLEEYTKLPDFEPVLLLRMGRCYYDSERRWESIVVFDRLCQRHPDSVEREPALFGMITAAADVSLVKRCQKLCEQYLKDFPSGPNAGTFGYLSGAVALQARDYASAVTYFGKMLQQVPNSQFRAEMRFLLANARFMQAEYEEAAKDYRKYLADNPKGKDAEESEYRIALTQMFTGHYDEALPLLTGYLQRFPSAAFGSDCRYRIAVCKYSASQYEEVATSCREWVKDFPGNGQEGEVQALLGDALAAQGNLKEAIKAYQRSYQIAATDEVLNYSLFEAGKHLQKLGEWGEVTHMFEEFLKNKPDNPSAVAAMYWVGKARARQGRLEEAKIFLVENLKKYIADPKRESVESLLTLLAQLCAKPPPPPPAPAAAPGTPAPAGAATPAPASTLAVARKPAPTPPPYDAMAELNRHLLVLEDTVQPIIQARLLAARADLARLIKRPSDAENFVLEISKFQPNDLSAVLLAQVGDFLMQRDEKERAQAYFEKLKEDYPKSDYVEYAYVGLGDLALDKKQYPKALDLFTDVIDKIGASLKLKEATIGRGRALMELARYDEAEKVFEQVSSVREWRGESTAYAVYTIGEIEFRKGRYAEAIARYRRVFVAYQKYLPWVVRSPICAPPESVQTKWAVASGRDRQLERNVAQPEADDVSGDGMKPKQRLRAWGVAAWERTDAVILPAAVGLAVLGLRRFAVSAQNIILKDGRTIAARGLRRQGNVIMARVEQTGSDEVVGTKAVGEVGYSISNQIAKIEFPRPPQLSSAPFLIVQGKPGDALAQIEPVFRYYDGFLDAPGSWWAQAALLKVQALVAMGNRKEAEPLIDLVAKTATDPETSLAARMYVGATLARKGDHAKAIEVEDAVLQGATSNPMTLAAAAIFKGESQLASKQYEDAIFAFLQIPVFYPEQKLYMPQALLGSGRAFFAMEDFRGNKQAGRA